MENKETSCTLEDLELLAAEMADHANKGKPMDEAYFLSKLKEAAQLAWSGDVEEEECSILPDDGEDHDPRD